ncbi:MAG: class I SAM-dependent methyltransferase, partial [Hyphomicrobiales bacterium]|nr:class I SAM-dependent methyltransferase [Hyphomicrobiales bacterium]
RLTVMREPDGMFDVLVIDAFSSDAIPVHLMTREAIAGYFEKLAPGGILVMHISNRFLELRNVLAAIATSERLAGVARLDKIAAEEMKVSMRTSTEAVILARSPDEIEHFVDAGWDRLTAVNGSTVRAWTDDYSNIIAAILRRRSQQF